jgi:hypothetical protein
VKKVLLVFVSTFLFGSSAYAQSEPDWKEHWEAKKVLDDMATLDARGLTLEEAVKNDKKIYSPGAVRDLMSIAGLDNIIPLAKCTDYLSKAEAITAELKLRDGEVYSDIEYVLKAVKENLNKRPFKHFIKRLVKLGAIYLKYGSGNLEFKADIMTYRVTTKGVDVSVLINDEFTAEVAEGALAFFLNKELNKDDFDAILGTDLDEKKDGLLALLWGQYLSAETVIELFPKVKELQLKLLCSNTNLTAGTVAGIMLSPYGKDLGRRLIGGVTKPELSEYLNEYLKTTVIKSLRAGIESQVMDQFDIIKGFVGE